MGRREGMMISFGYPEGNLQYNDHFIHEYIHPDDLERVTKNIETQLDNKQENWEDEYRFRCADGSYKHEFDRGLILFDADDKPNRMIGAMTDFTDRKRLERQLAEQQLNQQKIITEVTILEQEKERNELGIELHDNINQILATVKLYLGMIKASYVCRHPNTFFQRLFYLVFTLSPFSVPGFQHDNLILSYHHPKQQSIRL